MADKTRIEWTDASWNPRLSEPNWQNETSQVGGESGPNARPMNPDWARSLRDQCAEAGVKFFMKQMAKKAPIPSDLMVREFPT